MCLKNVFKRIINFILFYLFLLLALVILWDNSTKLISTMVLPASLSLWQCDLLSVSLGSFQTNRPHHKKYWHCAVFFLVCLVFPPPRYCVENDFPSSQQLALRLKCKSAADSGCVVSMLKRGITMEAAEFQVHLEIFLDSHKANYKKTNKTSRQKEPLDRVVKRGIISLPPHPLHSPQPP